MREPKKCVGDQPRNIKLTLTQIKALGIEAQKSTDLPTRKLGFQLQEFSEREMKKEVAELDRTFDAMFEACRKKTLRDFGYDD